MATFATVEQLVRVWIQTVILGVNGWVSCTVGRNDSKSYRQNQNDHDIFHFLVLLSLLLEYLKLTQKSISRNVTLFKVRGMLRGIGTGYILLLLLLLLILIS